jgi:hypothetical protein
MDARFPERWLSDARLQRVPPSAYRLHGNALMWSVSNRTDGHVPSWALPLIPHGNETDAKELTGARLWEATSDGWRIVDYLDTQSSRDQLDALTARRRSDKERKAAERKRRSEAASADESRDRPAERSRQGQARQGQDRARTGRKEQPPTTGDAREGGDAWCAVCRVRRVTRYGPQGRPVCDACTEAAGKAGP